MDSGPKQEPWSVERIIIPKSELQPGSKWTVQADGLLRSPDGRTVFPTYDPDGRVTGSHSYYLDPTAAVVKSVFSVDFPAK